MECTVPHHPEAASLIEQWKDLMKSQLQCQLCSNSLQVWDVFLQKTVYSQHPMCGTVSFLSRIHWSRNQEVEMGVAPLIITTIGPLAQFLLPVPMIL